MYSQSNAVSRLNFSPPLGMSPAHSKDLIKSPMGKAGRNIINYNLGTNLKHQMLPPAGARLRPPTG